MDVVTTVDLGERSYPVVIRSGALDQLPAWLERVLPAPRVVLVSDERVEPLWGDAVREPLLRAGVEVATVVIPAGEARKTLDTWSRCVDGLLAAGVGRRTPVLALGGGVVGDVAGFAAAACLRGLPWVQLPTTVLALVDSSVGGKTGVNHPTGKNLVGAYHQPRLVLGDLDTLGTLDPAERVAGLGEVLKAALLGGGELLEVVERGAAALRRGDPEVLAGVAGRCVEVKAAIVAGDERESGRRAVLNLGHTVGHALERASGFGTLRHGEAVALGLVAECRWAVARGLCHDRDLPARIERIGTSLGLPGAAPVVDRDLLLQALGVDKKRSGDTLWLPVLRRAGSAELVRVPVERLHEMLEEIP